MESQFLLAIVVMVSIGFAYHRHSFKKNWLKMLGIGLLIYVPCQILYFSTTYRIVTGYDVPESIRIMAERTGAPITPEQARIIGTPIIESAVPSFEQIIMKMAELTGYYLGGCILIGSLLLLLIRYLMRLLDKSKIETTNGKQNATVI